MEQEKLKHHDSDKICKNEVTTLTFMFASFFTGEASMYEKQSEPINYHEQLSTINSLHFCYGWTLNQVQLTYATQQLYATSKFIIDDDVSEDEST